MRVGEYRASGGKLRIGTRTCSKEMKGGALGKMEIPGGRITFYGRIG